MSKIVSISKARKAKSSKKYEPMTTQTVQDWVESDIQKLMKATNQSKEQAIKMATDFYRAYPALIESVREQVIGQG